MVGLNSGTAPVTKNSALKKWYKKRKTLTQNKPRKKPQNIFHQILIQTCNKEYKKLFKYIQTL